MGPSRERECLDAGLIWACSDFISKDMFLAPPDSISSTRPRRLRLKDVDLAIFCEGFGAGGRALPSRHELWQPTAYGLLSRAFSDFESLLEEGRMSDFKIRIDDGSEIPVHKLILAARSPVFEAMFKHDMAETQKNVVVIEGVRRQVLYMMLRYVYCGKVKDIDDVNLELLALAHRYEMTDLKDICEVSLLDSLTIENAPELLIIADMYDTPILKRKAIAFVNRYAKRIIPTRAYQNMTESHPHLVVELFENTVEKPTLKDIPKKPVRILCSAAEEAFFTYDDIRKDFAASDRKPGKR